MTCTKIVLDMGCGRRKHTGAIGVDVVPFDLVDVVSNLSVTPYAFASECADEVILSHVLEHFAFEDVVRILEEVWRILKPGGDLVISVPHAGSIATYSDPTHRTFFTFASFYYLLTPQPIAPYKDLSSRWRIDRVWTSVNIFSNKFQVEAAWQLRLNNLASRILGRILRGSRTMTLPELIVKFAPFWLVSVHARLKRIGPERKSS